MITHNVCFCGEIRKIFTGYPLLSRPMYRKHLLWEDILKKESVVLLKSLSIFRLIDTSLGTVVNCCG